MTVKTENVELLNNIKDDVFETSEEQEVDDGALAALKAKLAKKTEALSEKKEEMPIKIVAEKTRSIRFGVCGSGQAGSRLAESLYKIGYETVVFNTASQDLKHIEIPESNKYLLDYTLGGAAKDLEIGKAAAEAHRDAIAELVSDKLGDCQALLLCLSLGGGSGAGSVETMIDVMAGTGKPLVVITVLPMSAEDAQTKQNALETLSKIAKEVQNKRVHNIIVVDNAKIESIFSDVSEMDFFEVSNQAIVKPFDAFNSFSSMPSRTKALDSMEFAKIMTDGGGLCVYGQMTVSDYLQPTAIADAVIENLSNGLLATGFDLKQTKYAGMIVVAKRSVLDQLPKSSINYALTMVEEVCGNPQATFRGTYDSEDAPNDLVTVYSIFSGLGLPESRVQQLQKETALLAANTKTKDAGRNLSLKVDTGKDDVTSAADKIRQQIASKKSAFGNLLNNVVQDKRKK